MTSARDHMISWINRHNVHSVRAVAGMRCEALIDGDLKMIMEYDPLNPKSDAVVRLRLADLPYDPNGRKALLSAMLRLNHRLVAETAFAINLDQDAEGDYISLFWYAATLAMDRMDFEKIFQHYLAVARYACGLFNREERAVQPAMADAHIRYL